MRRSFASSFRTLTAVTLCAGLLVGSLPLSATRTPPPLQVDRASLMLERFTFGPRPGEIAQVRSMGVDAWFERQLAPERIDDSSLDNRLSMYPALAMSQEERLERYPTPAMLRQFAKNGNLPEEPEARAIVADQVEFYQMRQQAKANAKSGAVSPGAASAAVPNAMGAVASGQRNSSPAAMDGNAADAKMAVLPTQNAAQENLEQSTAAMPQAQVDAFLKLAPNERYSRLLRMPPEQLIALRKGLRGNEGKLGEGLTPLQRETLASLAGTNRMLSNEIFGARLLRDIYSDRQLEAVMTDFWLNHFNVYIRKDGQMPSLLPQYEEAVRSHALGRFEDLLKATAKSPAMLLYLDNAQSTGPDSVAAAGNTRGPKSNAKPNAKKANAGLNENYARELMELHTLGVNGGYTQRDVTEIAKVFTGWTMDRPGEGGEFTFNARRHEPGSKVVLGRTIVENGVDEGEQVLHLLSTSPATAHFLSLELAQRFVSDAPPPALVDRMAQTFLQSQGDTKAVLRTMVRSPEFFSAATVHAKLKTPLEYVVSTVRATNAEVQNPVPLAQALERFGMPLYGCQPPTGYKWDSATWLSSSALVNRMNFALLLSANKVGGTSVDLSRLLHGSAFLSGNTVADLANPAGKERALEAVLLDAPASAQTRGAVLSQTDDRALQQAVQSFGPGMGNPDPGRSKQGVDTVGGKRMVNVETRVLGAAPVKPGPPPVDRQGAVMLGLLLGSPEFQRR